MPVGLTKHRKGLAPLQRFDADSARKLLEDVHAWQDRLLKELGTRFVYPSDEFYCLCGAPIPEDPAYEGYPQIENGVGMLRLLEQECADAYEYLFADGVPERKGESLLIPTGVSAQPFIESLTRRFAPVGTDVQVIPVVNRFFGETITVTGLIVGRDLIDALKGKPCDRILLCDTMLRENTDRFLDDTTLENVRQELGVPVRVVRNNGESLIRALWGLEEEDV